MSYLICPVCKKELNMQNNSLKCANNHAFDFAKEGYVKICCLAQKAAIKQATAKIQPEQGITFLIKITTYALKSI